MSAGILQPEVRAHGLDLDVSFQIENRSREAWDEKSGFAVGWQLFDPETSLFIAEGPWTKLDTTLEPGHSAPLSISIGLPGEPGRYHVYVSPRSEREGWHYEQQWPFLLVEANVRDGGAEAASGIVTTLGAVHRRDWRRKAAAAIAGPWISLWGNRRLIASLTRREIAARYRGSIGGLLWTVLHPLLLMLTYMFVFGIVLGTKFGGDPSRSGFVLHFLAGMLPWLPLSEAISRSASVVVENRNFVKKLVFPVAVLPVSPALAGLAGEAIALTLFLVLLFASRGAVPATILSLPLLLVPQLLLTLGACWFLAALGVYLRDLGQLIGFLLTLIFFLTPICYPEESLPAWAMPVLSKSPVYMLVNGYRSVLLYARLPDGVSLAALWGIALLACLAGYACFRRLQKTFADVI